MDSSATKREIKQAVELMFEGVEVVKVNTLNTKGKTKRFGRVVGKRSDVKKAYVTLKTGSDVQIGAGEEATGETATNE